MHGIMQGEEVEFFQFYLCRFDTCTKHANKHSILFFIFEIAKNCKYACQKNNSKVSITFQWINGNLVLLLINCNNQKLASCK